MQCSVKDSLLNFGYETPLCVYVDCWACARDDDPIDGDCPRCGDYDFDFDYSDGVLPQHTIGLLSIFCIVGIPIIVKIRNIIADCCEKNVFCCQSKKRLIISSLVLVAAVVVRTFFSYFLLTHCSQ